MKTYQEETETAFHKIPQGTISHVSHKNGMRGEEPLIVILDALIGYAKSYLDHYGSSLSEDYVLGPEFLKCATGVRGLLNGQGAIAMTQGITADSKDNGACEEMFWAAINLSGYTEADF